MRSIVAKVLVLVMVLLTGTQHWTFSVQAKSLANVQEIQVGKNYAIISKLSGKAMTVENYSVSQSAKICQNTYGGYESQIWNFEKIEDGYYIIKNHKSGKVLDIPWEVSRSITMIFWKQSVITGISRVNGMILHL